MDNPLQAQCQHIQEAMQPVVGEQTYMLGSLKSCQKCLYDIQLGLQGGYMGIIDKPLLDDLNPEQLNRVHLALEGHSLFITGAAGTWPVTPGIPL